MAHSTMASTAHTVLSLTPRGPHRALASVMPKPTHPGKATSYVGQTVWGFPLSKREAGEEPEAA